MCGSNDGIESLGRGAGVHLGGLHVLLVQAIQLNVSVCDEAIQCVYRVITQLGSCLREVRSIVSSTSLWKFFLKLPQHN